MSKQILYGIEARKKIQSGINKLADAVKTTIGPKGMNAVLGRSLGNDIITNDGVSIAKEIELEDKFENIGANLIRQVAEKTNDGVGDGTTTSTILTQALVNEGMKFVETGINAVGIRRGMEMAKESVIEFLKKNSRRIKTKKEIAQVATISAESEEMGDLIAEVISEIGGDGFLTVETSQTVGLSKEILRGMSFERGFLAPTDDLVEEIDEPSIIITDKKIHSLAQIIGILDDIVSTGNKNVLIIADSYEEKVLYDLALSKVRGAINAICVMAPEFADTRKRVLMDIAILTGAKLITGEMKLEEQKKDICGSARKVVSTRTSTTIMDGAGKKKAIKERVDEVKKLIKAAEVISDREILKKRLAKLTGGVGIIRVGAASDTETTYLKHKLDDAIAATKAAIEEGVVIGGGGALAKVRFEDRGTTEEKAGCAIVRRAIKEPILQIVKNTGSGSPDVVLEHVMDGGATYGFDAKNEKYVADMFREGIIDPLRVTRMSVENAVSVASLVLTTETAVVDNDK